MGQAGSVSPAEELSGGAPQQKEFRPDIEGLRAVAVIAVVLFHAAVPRFGGGYVGVDVFFVISGFLITGLLWREVRTTGTVRLSNFYGARARRLLPASAAVGVITMIASAFLLPPLQARTVFGDGLASALYVSNYRFLLQGIDYFASRVPPSPFLHYWSLGIEEQFYLVWAPMTLGIAWLVKLVRRRRRTTVDRADARSSWQSPYLVILALIAAMSFVLSWQATPIAPTEAFYSLATRTWQFAVGGLVAVTVVHWSRLATKTAAVAGWAGLTLILLACTWLTPATPYPGTVALLPTLGTVLVIGAGCATPTQGCGRLLGLSPIRAIGRISYSWYLWHWPVLALAPALLGRPLGPTARGVAVILSAGLAWLTLRYLENPLRFSGQIRTSPLRSLALGGTATVIAVCMGLGLLKVVPTPVGFGSPAALLDFTAIAVPPGSDLASYDRSVLQIFAQVQTAVAVSADLGAVPSNLSPPLARAATEEKAVYLNGCLRDFFQVEQPECALGDTESATTVALVGDSHAAMWNPAFRQLADQRRWRIETLAKASCPLLDLPITNPIMRRQYTECKQWRDHVMVRLSADRPRLVTVAMWRGYGSIDWPSGFESYDPAWLDSLTRMVRKLRETGARVLVLGPIPDPQSVVPLCLSGHLDDATACAPPRSTAVNESGIAAEAAATKSGGGEYADLTDLFCTAERCPVIVGNNLVYFDWSHMTLEYSRALAPVIGTLADRTLALNG